MYETSEKISELGLANSAAVLHPAGTVALSRTASVGFSCIFGTDMATSQDFVTWTCSPALRPRYLLYALRGLREEILGMRMGSTHQTIYMPDVERISIPLPPMQVQEAIAAFLDAQLAHVDKLISMKRQMIKLVNERINVMRESWVDRLRMQYGMLPLRRVCSAVEQGWSPQCDTVPADHDEWGVLKTSSVSGGQFDATENKRLPDHIRPDPRWIVVDGDLLITRGSGSSTMVGRTAVARTDGRKLMLSDLLYRVRLTGGANPEFLSMVLGSGHARRHFEGSIRTDAGQTMKLRIDDLKSVPVPALPIDKQAHAVASHRDRTSAFDSLANRIQRQLTLLHEHRQALITAAVAGEMEVPGVAS